MEFLETPLFIICISLGIIFILAGLIQWYFRPKKINPFYGYRTNSSMKSQERWDFAQKYSAKEMMRLGALLAIVPFLSLFFEINSSIEIFIPFVLLLLLVLLLFWRTEKALKQHFKS